MVTRLLSRLLKRALTVSLITVYLVLLLYYLPRTVPAESEDINSLQSGRKVTRTFDTRVVYPGTKRTLARGFNTSHFILHFQVVQDEESRLNLRVSRGSDLLAGLGKHQCREAGSPVLPRRGVADLGKEKNGRNVSYSSPGSPVVFLDIPLDFDAAEPSFQDPIYVEASIANLFDIVLEIWPPIGDSALLYWWFTRKTFPFPVFIRRGFSVEAQTVEIWPAPWHDVYDSSFSDSQPLLTVDTSNLNTDQSICSSAAKLSFKFPPAPASVPRTSYYHLRLLICLLVAPFAITLWLISYAMFEYPIIPFTIRLMIVPTGGIPAIFIFVVLCDYGRWLWAMRRDPKPIDPDSPFEGPDHWECKMEKESET